MSDETHDILIEFISRGDKPLISAPSQQIVSGIQQRIAKRNTLTELGLPFLMGISMNRVRRASIGRSRGISISEQNRIQDAIVKDLTINDLARNVRREIVATPKITERRPRASVRGFGDEILINPKVATGTLSNIPGAMQVEIGRGRQAKRGGFSSGGALQTNIRRAFDEPMRLIGSNRNAGEISRIRRDLENASLESRKWQKRFYKQSWRLGGQTSRANNLQKRLDKIKSSEVTPVSTVSPTPDQILRTNVGDLRVGGSRVSISMPSSVGGERRTEVFARHFEEMEAILRQREGIPIGTKRPEVSYTGIDENTIEREFRVLSRQRKLQRDLQEKARRNSYREKEN